MPDYITTFTKLHVDPMNASEDDIKIEDIAHSLSLQCRANGHYPRFYTVAQHCMDCCAEAEARHLPVKLQLACLLHDAGEAYFSDLPKPVKDRLPEYKKYEEKILSLIYKKFLTSPLTGEERAEVNRIDYEIFCHEFNAVMGERPQAELPKLFSRPEFKTRPAIEMEEAYKAMFRKLLKKLGDDAKDAGTRARHIRRVRGAKHDRDRTENE